MPGKYNLLQRAGMYIGESAAGVKNPGMMQNFGKWMTADPRRAGMAFAGGAGAIYNGYQGYRRDGIFGAATGAVGGFGAGAAMGMGAGMLRKGASRVAQLSRFRKAKGGTGMTLGAAGTAMFRGAMGEGRRSLNSIGSTFGRSKNPIQGLPKKPSSSSRGGRHYFGNKGNRRRNRRGRRR